MMDTQDSNQEHNVEKERMMILDMLNEQKISLAEAETLLETLNQSDDSPSEAPMLTKLHTKTDTPDLPNSEQLWVFPFGTGLVSLLLFGSLLRRSKNIVAVVFLLPLVFLSAGLAGLGLLGRKGHWIHVRVNAKDGTNVRISLPLPIKLTSWFLRTLQPVIESKVEGNIEFDSKQIADMVEMMGDELSPDNPLVVQVDDNGDKVLVYIT